MTPLQYARGQLGISKLKLSELADVWPTQITRIENGRPATEPVAKKLLPHLGGYVTLLDLRCPGDFIVPKSKNKKAA